MRRCGITNRSVLLGLIFFVAGFQSVANGQLIRDVGIDHFEITQGLQNDENSIPLVADRPTIVRVFPRLLDRRSPIKGVSAIIRGGRHGVEFSDSPITPDNGSITADRASADRSDPSDSLNFTLPPHWYTEDAIFYAILVIPKSICYENPSNNMTRISAEFNSRGNLSIRYVLINYTNPNWTGPRLPRERVAEQYACDFLRSIYPIDPSRLTYDAWDPVEIEFDEGDSSGNLDGDALITELNTMYAVSSDPPDRLYGWTPQMSFPRNGLSDPLWAGGQNHVALGNDTGTDASPSLDWRWRRTFAHEIGHNTDENGLFHTSRRLQDDEIGFDILGTDPFGRIVMRTYPESDPFPDRDLFDFMRGGEVEPHAWITPPYHQILYDFFASEEEIASDAASALMLPENQQQKAAPQLGEDPLVVRGRLTPDGQGKFYPFYRIPRSVTNLKMEQKNPKQGKYSVRFYRNAQEIPGMRISWTPVFTNSPNQTNDSEEDLVRSRPFTWFITPQKGISRVDLLRGENVIDTLIVTKNSPLIEDLKQNTELALLAEAKNTKPFQLSWSFKDSDKEVKAFSLAGKQVTHLHQVYFTSNEGKDWKLIATGLKKAEANIDLENLTGGDKCRFQIRTSDGFNVAIKETDTFRLRPKTPEVVIVNPSKNRSIKTGTAITFIGRIRNETSDISSKNLVWTSNIQGELGKGEKVLARNLEVGKHTITVSHGTEPDSPSAKVVIQVLPE